ncbi:MAG: methylmalonyl-CoA mutase [Geobacteraceae bacterium]|nr:methylmalonyl-CoA mutase [Geobacteraceae bacterium]
MDNEITISMSEIPQVSFSEFLPTSYEDWKKEAVIALKGAPFEKRLFTQTYEDITLEPIYTREHLQRAQHHLEYSGLADFMRGTKFSGYITKPWTIAQLVDSTIPTQANKAIRLELDRGNEAIHLILHRSTLLGSNGRAINDSQALKKGLILDTIQDMDDVLRDIGVRETELNIFTGISAISVLGLIAAQARASGRMAHLREYQGRIGADPIGVLAEEGELPCFMDEFFDEMALAIHWSSQYMPGIRTIMVRGDVYHNGGANAVQELSYCMSTAISYINALQIRGLDINIIAKQISFKFSIGSNFFMEIAKLRAARMLWAHIVQAYSGEEEAQKLDVIAETSRFTQTIYDPYVNILRATTQSFAGIIGGVDALCVIPFDDPIGDSDEVSKRIARNIQLMFRNEFDLLRPVDPAGGSWYIERLTCQIAEAAWDSIQKINDEGGIIAKLKNGSIQEEIGKVLQNRKKNLATRADRVVGTNMYSNPQEKPLQRPSGNFEVIMEQRTREIEEYISGMDETYRKKCIEVLPAKISGEPLDFMRSVIDAFMAGAAAYEVRTALNDDIPGDLHVKPIRSRRWTEDFEELRNRTKNYEKDTGNKIQIFLANMGPLAQHKARADFVTGFMEIAGFEVFKNNGFSTIEDAVVAATTSGASVTVICSTDETYPELVPPLAKRLKASFPGMPVLLAGAPPAEYIECYKKAGVDDFVHIRSNCLEILQSIQRTKGLY